MTEKRIALICPRLTGADAAALGAGLAARGFYPAPFRDGDTGVLAVDAVVLVGTPSAARRTIAALSCAGRARPRVIVWLFEPLAPPDLPERFVRLAGLASPVRTGLRGAKPVLRVLSYPFDLALTRATKAELTPGALRFVIDNQAVLDHGLRRRWLDAILVSTRQKQEYLAALGIASDFAPVGQQAGFGRDKGGIRDIDLLFIGSAKSPRRRAALSRLIGQVEAAGLRTHVPDGPVWGERRTDLVNRAKILLHLHQYPWDTPWMRWCLASANGAAMASEPLSVPSPFTPGHDYLSAPLDTLGSAIVALARDEGKRARMVRNCAATIEGNLMQDQSISLLATRLTELLEEPAR